MGHKLTLMKLSGYLHDTVRGLTPDGRVLIIIPRRQAKSFTLRRKGTELTLTVPWGYPCNDIMPRFNELIKRFDAKYPAPAIRYSAKQIISCHGVEFELYPQSIHPAEIITSCALPRTRLGIGSDIPLHTDRGTAFVSRALCRAAERIAPQLLIPLASEIAGDTGIRPASWRIGHGLRTLGTCSAQRVITLSCALVFLSPSLRRYIICHELAHLTHMNHSAAFHTVCNRYLDGQEKQLIAALRNYAWPILR